MNFFSNISQFQKAISKSLDATELTSDTTFLDFLELLLVSLLAEVRALKRVAAGNPKQTSISESSVFVSFDSGSTRGLSDKIKDLLASSPVPLTSAQITDRLYEPNALVDKGTFRRRVIVATSALHKSYPPELIATDQPGRGREKYWTVPVNRFVALQSISQLADLTESEMFALDNRFETLSKFPASTKEQGPRVAAQ